jgi:hypothetical protein
MVDLTNLFTQIIAPFNTDSSVKVPSPFTASKEELNFADYQNLNNDMSTPRIREPLFEKV